MRYGKKKSKEDERNVEVSAIIYDLHATFNTSGGQDSKTTRGEGRVSYRINVGACT